MISETNVLLAVSRHRSKGNHAYALVVDMLSHAIISRGNYQYPFYKTGECNKHNSHPIPLA